VASVTPSDVDARRGATSPRRSLPAALFFLAFTIVALTSQKTDAQTGAQRHFFALGNGNADTHPLDTHPPTRMIPLQATMSQAYPVIGVNADGSDLWPCHGRTPSNADCPTIDVPALPLPHGTFVTGVPAYSWALKNDGIFGFGHGNGVGCDAYADGTIGLAFADCKPCGQIATFFEDDTNDANDDLLQRVIVTQGLNVIFDSGVVDFGPAGPTVDYPVDVELYYDANFGFWPGAKSGPNNGNCSPDVAYPPASPALPGVIRQIVGGSTCHRPVAGKARIHAETVLAAPGYQQATGDPCSRHGVASPCYTVAWEQKYQIDQHWDVVLR